MSSFHSEYLPLSFSVELFPIFWRQGGPPSGLAMASFQWGRYCAARPVGYGPASTWLMPLASAAGGSASPASFQFIVTQTQGKCIPCPCNFPGISNLRKSHKMLLLRLCAGRAFPVRTLHRRRAGCAFVVPASNNALVTTFETLQYPYVIPKLADQNSCHGVNR